MGQRLYNSNDGSTGRDGGPYLDLVEVEQAEKRRAVVEDREPDYENPPATAGIQLNSAAQMLHTDWVNSQPSRQSTVVEDATRRFDALHDDENVPLFAFTEIPDDALTNKSRDELGLEDDPEKLQEEGKTAANPEGTATNPTDDAHEEGKDGDVEGNTPGSAESAEAEANKTEAEKAQETNSGSQTSDVNPSHLPSHAPPEDNTENPESGGNLVGSRADGDTTPETQASSPDPIFGSKNN